MNFYKTSGTVAAGSTSTTLVTTGNVFNNGMVGDTVYNSTDDEKAVITAYTSATTVTLDTEIDDDWDGDTIYVLGHEFGLGGNATDAQNIISVGVKYSSDDDYYRTCRNTPKSKLFQDGNENYYETDPRWYPTTVDIGGVATSAIGILPEASENVANGVEITYKEQPAALSADADVPRLPLGSHSILVYGGTASALRKLMRLDEADRFEQMYQAEKVSVIMNYQLTRASGVPKITPSRRLKHMRERNI
jgi:azurin